MSSPKESDYQIAGEKKVIRKSIVPQSELLLYDIENEQDCTYKDLVQNEIIFIRKNIS